MIEFRTATEAPFASRLRLGFGYSSGAENAGWLDARALVVARQHHNRGAAVAAPHRTGSGNHD
ncbi:MAG TPA: hypothetical protein VEI01_23350 [Terriglobales bacterium]|nr:hypothetical protein [Terriglobales bacterium]